MRTLMTKLKFSLILNLGLVGCLILAVATRPTAHVNLDSTQQTGERPERKPLSFSWAQLEPSSNDYAVYVANLRRIGCPEATIFDIVRGDAERDFEGKRQELHLAPTPGGPWSKESAIRLATGVLGLEAPERNTPAELEARSQERVLPAQELVSPAPARYALGSQSSKPELSGFNDARKMGSGKIQQQLTASLTGNNSPLNDAINQSPSAASNDPGSPANARQWQVSGQNNDDALLGSMGTQEYLALQYEHYYTNFQKQILNAGDGLLIINPDLLAQ